MTLNKKITTAIKKKYPKAIITISYKEVQGLIIISFQITNSSPEVDFLKTFELYDEKEKAVNIDIVSEEILHQILHLDAFECISKITSIDINTIVFEPIQLLSERYYQKK